MFKIRKIVSALMISSLILLMVTACAEFSELDSHSAFSRFQQSEDTYRAGMRWGEWSGVLYLMRPKPISTESEKIITITDSSTGKEYQVVESQTENYNDSLLPKLSREELLKHLATIKVSHIEALESSMSKEKGTGISRLRIEYHFDNSAIIKTLHYKVSWWYDKQSNTWFTDTPLPKEFDLPKHKTIKLSPKRY